VLVGPTEHPSVREAALALRLEGFEVEFLTLDASGGLAVESVARLARPDTVLVAQMLVQNEVGTIYPVREVARALRRVAPRAHLHMDAVQALGKLELSLHELGADSLTISAHKAAGPMGAGALLVREDARLVPLVHGGKQERGWRSGTENVAGIVGLGAAVESAENGREEACVRMRAIRAAFVEEVSRAEGVRVLSPGTERTPGSPAIVALLVPGAPAEVWLHHLEARGVYASTGSACQSKKKEQSPTYAALGLSIEAARAVLRFSFDSRTAVDDARAAAGMLAEIAHTLAGVRT
jgi:cysteine desulfurase